MVRNTGDFLIPDIMPDFPVFPIKDMERNAEYFSIKKSSSLIVFCISQKC